MDAAALPGDWKRRERDSWDQELDKGKVNVLLCSVHVGVGMCVLHVVSTSPL